MTDRIKGFIVVLDEDIRTDDVEQIVNAIRCIKHVISVEKSVANPDDYFARERVRAEFSTKLWSVLYPDKK